MNDLVAPKVGALVNLNRVVVPSKAQASLSVAVRVRPVLKAEAAKNGKRDIIRVLDGKVVLILDPDESKDYLDQVQNRTKEKRYTFDVAYEATSTNRDVYQGSIADLAAGVVQGLNGTVFAYGATGSGKTHTMVGTKSDPGLMVQSLAQIFKSKEAMMGSHDDEEFIVTCSYLEVYNELIYDLLVKSSGPLELREDPDQGVCVAGLQRITVTSAAEIMGLLEEGNHRRKTDSTDANATSSRSHAVLEILVRRQPRNQLRGQVLMGKLSLVDLAGSERAAETNNNGQKLRDGANINKSLLALANCINALGKQQKTGVAYVPYRNSKLTRLLKDSLSGNSRTSMVATISAAADQYHHSVNTLKYADRAKEIKTHVVQNLGSVERHVADYQGIISTLQTEVQQLRGMLADRSGAVPAPLPAGGPGGGSTAAPSTGVSSSEADALSWIDGLVQEVNENIEERINLQKALFELEDINVCNQYELQNLEEMLCSPDVKLESAVRADAEERRQALREEVAENSAAAQRYRSDIAANEATRREIQGRIEAAIQSNSNANFLKVLSTFRIQAVRLQELKFQMAVRDQIISEQRDVISNLWRILQATGLSRDQITDLARHEGILMQGFMHDDGEGPPTVGASQLAGMVTAGSAAPHTPMALPGAPPAVQQSLMGSKARYRYRFWQQYAGQQSMAGAANSVGRGQTVGFRDTSPARATSGKPKQGNQATLGRQSPTADLQHPPRQQQQQREGRSPSPLRQSTSHHPAAAAAAGQRHQEHHSSSSAATIMRVPPPVPHRTNEKQPNHKPAGLHGITNKVEGSSPSRTNNTPPRTNNSPPRNNNTRPGSASPQQQKPGRQPGASPFKQNMQHPEPLHNTAHHHGHTELVSQASAGSSVFEGPLAALRQSRRKQRALVQDGWSEHVEPKLNAVAKQQQLVHAYGAGGQDKLARLKQARFAGGSHQASAAVSAEPSSASLDLPHPAASRISPRNHAAANAHRAAEVKGHAQHGRAAGQLAGQHHSNDTAAAMVQRSAHSNQSLGQRGGHLPGAPGAGKGPAAAVPAKTHHMKGLEQATAAANPLLPQISESKLADLKRKQLQHLIRTANRTAAGDH